MELEEMALIFRVREAVKNGELPPILTNMNLDHWLRTTMPRRLDGRPYRTSACALLNNADENNKSPGAVGVRLVRSEFLSDGTKIYKFTEAGLLMPPRGARWDTSKLEQVPHIERGSEAASAAEVITRTLKIDRETAIVAVEAIVQELLLKKKIEFLGFGVIYVWERTTEPLTLRTCVQPSAEFLAKLSELKTAEK